MVSMQRQGIKDLLLRARVVVTTANMKISCRLFADYVVKISEPKRVPHVQHDYFFLIQPIKSSSFGVVVAVAFVLNYSP